MSSLTITYCPKTSILQFGNNPDNKLVCLSYEGTKTHLFYKLLAKNNPLFEVIRRIVYFDKSPISSEMEFIVKSSSIKKLNLSNLLKTNQPLSDDEERFIDIHGRPIVFSR